MLKIKKIEKTKIKKTKRNKKTKRIKKANGNNVPSLKDLASKTLASNIKNLYKLKQAKYPDDVIVQVMYPTKINAAKIIAQKFHSIPTNLSYMEKLIDGEQEITPVQRTELNKNIEYIRMISKNNQNDWWNKKVTKKSIGIVKEKLREFLNPTEDPFEYDYNYYYNYY